jgi:hypothetical protein
MLWFAARQHTGYVKLPRTELNVAARFVFSTNRCKVADSRIDRC